MDEPINLATVLTALGVLRRDLAAVSDSTEPYIQTHEVRAELALAVSELDRANDLLVLCGRKGFAPSHELLRQLIGASEQLAESTKTVVAGPTAGFDGFLEDLRGDLDQLEVEAGLGENAVLAEAFDRKATRPSPAMTVQELLSAFEGVARRCATVKALLRERGSQRTAGIGADLETHLFLATTLGLTSNQVVTTIMERLRKGRYQLDQPVSSDPGLEQIAARVESLSWPLDSAEQLLAGD